MSWDNLLSGLLGSVFGGLIGAIVGFLGSGRLQRDTEESQRKAAGRAVLAEMFTNADRALSAESTRVLHEFLDAAWRGQLPLVARSLTWPDLKKVVSAYDSAARGFENAKDETRRLDRQRAIREQASVMGEELARDKHAEIEKERRKIDAWFRTVASEWLEAMLVLRSATIGCDERQAFDEDFRKLEERLESANALGELD